MRINCGDCRFFTPTGFQDFYFVGRCGHPEPALGGAMVRWDNTAEWLSCYQAKRRRGSVKLSDADALALAQSLAIVVARGMLTPDTLAKFNENPIFAQELERCLSQLQEEAG